MHYRLFIVNPCDIIPYIMRIIATAFFICLATATTAFAANPYVVSEKTSDGFLLQDDLLRAYLLL